MANRSWEINCFSQDQYGISKRTEYMESMLRDIRSKEYNDLAKQQFGVDLYAPSMGRKIEREDELDIHHLPYMTWVEWMNNLSKYKYAVHLMPTHAAGTFSLNCAYHGIPCIGYRNSDTQSELHPNLTVDDGDMYSAVKLARKLKMDDDFYIHCSAQSKLIYKNSGFTENNYIYSMRTILKEVINEEN